MSLAIKTSERKSAAPRTCNGDVAKVQQALNHHYRASIVSEDGILGEQTQAALRRFQQEQRLPVTGAADEKTLGALNSAPKTKSLLETKQDAAARSYAAQLDAMTRMHQVQIKVARAANENGLQPRGLHAEALDIGAGTGARTEVHATLVKTTVFANGGKDSVNLDALSAEIGGGILNKDGSVGINTSAEAVAVQFGAKKTWGANELRLSVSAGVGGHASFGARDIDHDGKAELCGELGVDFALGFSAGGCIELP